MYVFVLMSLPISNLEVTFGLKMSSHYGIDLDIRPIKVELLA